MKNIFVATICTRDLMFQVSSGEWFNLGDNQMRDNIISEQSEMVSDLTYIATNARVSQCFQKRCGKPSSLHVGVYDRGCPSTSKKYW